MSNLCSSNVTSGFIDLATFDELEKYMYGGPDATAYFVRDTRKATWFTQVPVVLSKASGSANFDTEWSVSISRAGDYLLSTWLRLVTPEIKIKATYTANGVPTRTLRWTKNFMHNIIRECCITFNDLVAARFDNYHLDFWAAFTVPASKKTGYDNMIGNFPEMIHPTRYAVPVVGNPTGNFYTNLGTIPSFVLNLPLPFFFCRDTGVALPTAALPYNDMRINFSFRNWTDLLIADDFAGGAWTASNPASPSDLEGSVTPILKDCQVWANYAIVSNDERKRMACAPRDILIEQVQTAPKQTYLVAGNAFPRYDIRFSHAIKALFFAVRNTTNKSEWSNYTGGSSIPSMPSTTRVLGSLSQGLAQTDPIAVTSLIYENTNRLSQMGSEYFSLVNPWYHSPTIPDETGYHLYSYSLDFYSLDPMGSTNYGKLTNVSIALEASSNALASAKSPTGWAAGASSGYQKSGADIPQSFEFITTAVSNNIIRISGGALGFPVL